MHSVVRSEVEGLFWDQSWGHGGQPMRQQAFVPLAQAGVVPPVLEIDFQALAKWP